MTSLNADGLMQDVVAGNFADETDGLEWKIGVDLTDRRWQARVAKFILGAANSIKEVADLGSGIAGVMVLGAEPGRIDARPVIDRAVLDNGLQRFLGRSSPDYALHYVPAGDGNYVTVVVVPMSPASMRPWTAHQSYSDPKGEIISDGGIYVRRGSRTEKAKAADIVELLRQRDFAVSMGPRPHELAWLDGDTLHLRHINPEISWRGQRGRVSLD